ncbi:MAG: hypothetical protein M3Q97_03625 [Bacteroidota bacterium]|nr:hypothetical protein [Bacteroidota bacterium]
MATYKAKALYADGTPYEGEAFRSLSLISSKQLAVLSVEDNGDFLVDDVVPYEEEGEKIMLKNRDWYFRREGSVLKTYDNDGNLLRPELYEPDSQGYNYLRPDS